MALKRENFVRKGSKVSCWMRQPGIDAGQKPPLSRPGPHGQNREPIGLIQKNPA
jgi:hypothetical protein